MQMPQPTEAHARLAALAGDWEGEETLHPAPWMPEGGTARGRFTNRVVLGGFNLVNVYAQTRGGQVVFEGHGVYGYDAERQRYTMYWFDSSGGDPGGPVPGRWEGDTLTFERRSEGGPSHRYVYVVSDESFLFRIEASRDGGTWTCMMEGTYHRVDAAR